MLKKLPDRHVHDDGDKREMLSICPAVINQSLLIQNPCVSLLSGEAV